jgi:signal transduction histidine kinase
LSETNIPNIKSVIDHKRILIILIATLVVFTSLYQLRPFLDDSQFAWISIPLYAILPATMVIYSTILAIKLFKQKHYQAKAFVFFSFGSIFLFIAEQIWQLYDHIWEGSPFPSEADIFYIASYPCMAAFLFISLKPVLKVIGKNVWIFAFAISFSLLIPSILASYDDVLGENAFAVSIALLYPLMSSILVFPAIIGVMFLVKKGANFSWMLILFGFIIFAIADTFFLFAELDGSYYDGHPVDLLWVFTYTMLVFAIHIRLKITKIPSAENQAMFFHEKIQFETITRFGIPLTLAIITMVIVVSLFAAIFIETDEHASIHGLMFGVVGILIVFIAVVLTFNKNLSRLVKMRTNELIEQKDNLEHLVDEKTHELIKSERLSAIGELSGRLAHDLRNPLSVIKMSVDLLNHNPSDKKLSDPEVANRIEMIQKSVDRISHQIDDVLGYVRNSPMKLTTISVYHLIQNSIEKIHTPTYIQIKVEENDVEIQCDPTKLEVVFLNLLSNSIQAIPNGGRIKINILKKSDKVIIDFIDSGKRIPDEVIGKIFEPLFTTKQRGTGLGLASCKNIVEQHQGQISVKNNPTTFTVILPKNPTVLS